MIAATLTRVTIAHTQDWLEAGARMIREADGELMYVAAPVIFRFCFHLPCVFYYSLFVCLFFRCYLCVRVFCLPRSQPCTDINL
jgi:hypothetical protein